MTKKELELYVHIPFCVKKCAYCDFLSAPAGADERAAYVDALIREIRSKKENFREYRGRTPPVFLMHFLIVSISAEMRRSPRKSIRAQ